MARVTVEDCIDKVDNRFDLVLLAAHRARMISSGSQLTVDRDNDKNPVVSLREIGDGAISPEDLREDLIHSLQKNLDIKRAAAEGRWDDEDERGIRPPAGEWLDDLVRQGSRAALIFTEGDDGLVYLQDRLARRVRSVTESCVIRVVEVPGADYVDQTMGRCWQRPVVFEAIAAELTWLLGPAAPAATSPVSLAPWSATTKPSGPLTEV